LPFAPIGDSEQNVAAQQRLMDQKVELGNQQLSYKLLGRGGRLLLVFPGYGHTADSMLLFAPLLQEEYTCLFFDLPFQGNGNWRSHQPLRAEELADMAQRLLQQYGCSTMSLLGYSIGCRLCLSLLLHCPSLIHKVTLLAPDGLRIDPYYFFLTRTFIGKSLFRASLRSPNRYANLLSGAARVGLVNERHRRYALRHLSNHHEREQLGSTWLGLRYLLPAPVALKNVILNNKIPVSLFMGRFDWLIPVKHGAAFSSGLDTCKLYILEKGHSVFDSDNASAIANTLLKA
jgi:pimeloyl-ACP methyl ester carboxylesterase